MTAVGQALTTAANTTTRELRRIDSVRLSEKQGRRSILRRSHSAARDTRPYRDPGSAGPRDRPLFHTTDDRHSIWHRWRVRQPRPSSGRLTMSVDGNALQLAEERLRPRLVRLRDLLCQLIEARRQVAPRITPRLDQISELGDKVPGKRARLAMDDRVAETPRAPDRAVLLERVVEVPHEHPEHEVHDIVGPAVRLDDVRHRRAREVVLVLGVDQESVALECRDRRLVEHAEGTHGPRQHAGFGSAVEVKGTLRPTRIDVPLDQSPECRRGTRKAHSHLRKEVRLADSLAAQVEDNPDLTAVAASRGVNDALLHLGSERIDRRHAICLGPTAE